MTTPPKWTIRSALSAVPLTQPTGTVVQMPVPSYDTAADEIRKYMADVAAWDAQAHRAQSAYEDEMQRITVGVTEARARLEAAQQRIIERNKEIGIASQIVRPST
jgi:hypothetical protein